MHELYRPAEAPLVEPAARKPRSSIVAILLGGLVVDVLGAYMLGVSVILVWKTFTSGWSSNFQSVSESLMRSLALQNTLISLRILMAALGGYVAAHWARKAGVSHAAGAGTLAASWELLLASVGWIPGELRALHIPFAMLGGYLYARSQRER